MVAVRVYVEGGGDRRMVSAACRRGFTEFFRKALPPGRMPCVIACGSRSNAYDRFCIALRTRPDALNLLLVDSEGPVAVYGAPWRHLAERERWRRPDGATDTHAHLMVQCMESWFLADPRALADYFGRRFNDHALPRRHDVERIPKDDVLRSLDCALATGPGSRAYRKGRDAFAILERLDPGVVAGAAPHAQRLLGILTRRLDPS